MQRGWESGTGGLRPGTGMVGGVFWSRPRPYRGCSAWEWSEIMFRDWKGEKLLVWRFKSDSYFTQKAGN